MNILLDAYFDQNYGDDLFIKTITGMFKNCKFYSFLEYYPKEICDWAQEIPNLYLLPESDLFLTKNMFDAYICVGGDVFPDGGDYTKRRAYVESVLQANGIVAFLGFSLFHEYGEQTKADIAALMKDAHIIAPRDEQSAQILRQILPQKKIQSMADLAFSSEWITKEHSTEEKTLGISVRRPAYAEDETMEQYCSDLAATVNDFLAEDESKRVKMFSLSGGNFADEAVVEQIIGSVSCKERVEHIVYAGNVDDVKAQIAACDLVIGTRLHSIISCIAMNVPFLPVVYEVKTEHILKEIGYRGPVVMFGETESLQKDLATVRALAKADCGAAGCLKSGCTDALWDREALGAYLERSVLVLRELKALLGAGDKEIAIVKKDQSGPVSPEKEYGKKQTEEVVKKNAELEQLAEVVRQQQGTIEECQALIAQYLGTIGECQDLMAQYLNTIEELNKKNRKYVTVLEKIIGPQITDKLRSVIKKQ